MNSRRAFAEHLVRVLAATFALAAPLPPVHAQGDGSHYPERPIRLIVGFPPGGPNDLIARELAIRLGEILKQPIVVENRGGSNGEIATAAVAKSKADGYTLLFGSSGALAVSPSLQDKLAYDSIKDFAPIAGVASNPMLLVVGANSKYSTVADLIAAAKAKPGALTYASAGSGSPTHLSAVLLGRMASVDALHVPYKGGGPALTDLMGGQVDFYFGGIATALPLVQTNRLKAIGITSSKRSTLVPSVPAVGETLAGYESLIWYGLLAPAGTPKETLTSLANATATVLASPDFQKKMADHGAEVLKMGPDEFRTFIGSEIEKWGKIVKSTKATGG